MNRNRFPLIFMFLVLGMVGSPPAYAGSMHSLSWNNPTAYTDGTPIPSSLLTIVETKIYYSYDKQVWSLFATVPDGKVYWTGPLPPGEGVQAFYAVSATIPSQGEESLKSEAVEFPSAGGTPVGPMTVVIDNCADTYVNSGNRDFNHYSTESLIRTYSWPTSGEKCADCHTANSEPKKGEYNVANRGFIKWDLSSLPAGITVTNATLRLYYASEESGGKDPSYTVSVAKVIGADPVIPLCTWNTVDGIAPWTGGSDGGASNLATAESSAGIGTTHGWVTWDVTKMVQEWVVSPGTNYGMAVDADNFATHGSNRSFASREYPDPNLRPQLVVTFKKVPVVSVSIGNCEDTYVNLGFYASNVYSTESLIRTYTWPAQNVANRGFIKWDLSSLPAGITVTNATLRLYYASEESGGKDPSYTVSVAKVIGADPVIPLCTWNTVDGIAPWTGGSDGGASNLATAESSAGIGTTHGWVTWDVTKMVQEWVVSPGTNYGMAVDADRNASADSNRCFASREYPDANLRPQLVILYTTDRR